jgi:hypothetical protein
MRFDSRDKVVAQIKLLTPQKLEVSKFLRRQQFNLSHYFIT